jgi:hypothetical protein
MAVANTLAYYDLATITIVILNKFCEYCTKKHFRAVIVAIL